MMPFGCYQCLLDVPFRSQAQHVQHASEDPCKMTSAELLDPYIMHCPLHPCCCGAQQAKCRTTGVYVQSVSVSEKEQTADKLFAIMQIMLAVLARGYDWQVDLTEPIREFPLPLPRRGLPMTFKKLDQPLAGKSNE